MTPAAQEVDVAVLGAGPAGMSAAMAASRHGLKVALIDEASRAGGQVYRAPSFSPRAEDISANPDLARGQALRSALDASSVEPMFGRRLWFATPSLTLSTVGDDGPQWLQARALVVATGTSERVIPMPGLTLPGVIGLAAATIMLKAHAVVPGGPVLVAGVGPLLYAVAAGILDAGGRVAAVADLSRPGDWVRALPALASRPDLLRRGFGWMWQLRSAGVPLRFGHTVTEIAGDDAARCATISRVDSKWAPTGRTERFDVAAVAIGHGLTPASETARLLGVKHEYRAERGGFVPLTGADCETAIAGVYIAGDCAGISGAAAAEQAGTLAGMKVAHDLGALSLERFEQLARPVRTRRASANRFGAAISSLMTLRPGLAASMPEHTLVCRCEEVSRAAIDEATSRGVRNVNQLKSTTRCGMGPCQGRMCGDAAAELVALGGAGSRSQAGIWTARAPLRPLSIGELVGDYEYDDIPKITPLSG